MNFKNTTQAMMDKTFRSNAPFKFGKRVLAAAYLLTASNETWKRAKKAIHDKTIIFGEIDRNGLSTYGYALVTMAQDIYENTTHINLFDISDPYLISDTTMDLIFGALLIAREGYPITGVQKSFE